MNCKECQEKMLGAFAAGEPFVDREVSTHQRECPACRQFREAQADLFLSMDAGIKAMVNLEVPPSLLVGVRARLGQEPSTDRGWIFPWRFAVVAVVAILAVSIGYLNRRPGNQPNSPKSEAAVSQSNSNPVPTVQAPRKPLTVSPLRMHKRAGSSGPSEAIPEVLVLAEERVAFARFVAELPEEKDVAVALTRPTPGAADVAVEIALLQIERLQLNPLEGTPGE